MTPVVVLALALQFVVPSGGPSGGPSPASATSTASAATAAPVVSAWLGITLGETSKGVRAQLGKPREIVPTSVGDLWRYDIDNGNVTLELIINQNQVLNIAASVKDGKQSALADPVGGSLGMSAQALQSVRGAPIASYDNGASLAYGDAAGVRWFYSIDSGVVTRIEVSMPLPPPTAPKVLNDTYHDGSTVSRAFIVKAGTAADSTNAELAFLHTLACNPGGVWQVAGEELVTAAGRYYDLYHVFCSTTKTPRDFYFDVTDGFGK